MSGHIDYLNFLLDAASLLIQTPAIETCLDRQACLAKVDALLAQAGTSKSNALQATIWVKDIEADFKSMNAVWNAWVDPDAKPVRATVQAEMARPSILVEIQVTAALPE